MPEMSLLGAPLVDVVQGQNGNSRQRNIWSGYPVYEHTKVAAMLKKIRLFPGIFACMSALASIVQASAGEVRLVSDTMDMICRVEVTSGPDAPNAPVETYTDVKRDWSITKPDKLCYRRASTPDNCDSGMTQWNTQWKCAAKADSGIEELSLK
jgi:hypothetical protein